MLLAATAIVFVGLIALSLPIVFSLGAAAVVGLLIGGYPLEMVAQGHGRQLPTIGSRRRRIGWGPRAGIGDSPGSRVGSRRMGRRMMASENKG